MAINGGIHAGGQRRASFFSLFFQTQEMITARMTGIHGTDDGAARGRAITAA